jgi:hypothetical protein
MRYLQSFLILFVAVRVFAEPLPQGATKNLPVLGRAFSDHWPSAPLRNVAAGQVEQESDWNEHAHLHTSREDGYGLVQMTRTKSFNIYLTAVKYKALKGWDWRSNPYDPYRQLTFLVLQDKDNWDQVKAVNDEERWKMTLVSYNAGSGRIAIRRRYAMAKGLPTDRWTGGLELAHGALENSSLYGDSLWKRINNYPRVIVEKSEKYKGRL